MFDDLRERANESDYFSEEEPTFEYKDEEASSQSQQLFLGMTPIQRFVIAVMVFMMVCMMGTFFLLVTEKIYLPMI
jgi:hypothetical protein